MHSLINKYLSLCIKHSYNHDKEEFLRVEREIKLFVQECDAQGKISESNCPVDIIQIDEHFFYYVKIVTPDVLVNIITHTDLVSLGYIVK